MISNAFYSYRVSFSLIYLNCCHSTNDESDNDGSESWCPGTSVGSSGESVGSVSDVSFGNFFPTGI